MMRIKKLMYNAQVHNDEVSKRILTKQFREARRQAQITGEQ